MIPNDIAIPVAREPFAGSGLGKHEPLATFAALQIRDFGMKIKIQSVLSIAFKAEGTQMRGRDIFFA